METIRFIADHLGVFASIIGSIIAIGSAFIWLNKKIYLEPRDKKHLEQDRRLNEKMMKVTQDQMEPLMQSIGQLNGTIDHLRVSIDESFRDRANLNKIVQLHDDQISQLDEDVENIDKRVMVLEVKAGDKTIYKEEYGGK